MLLSSKKLMVLGVILISLLVFGMNSFAVSQGAVILSVIPTGARACALGEAFVAVADDASTAFWNPAGLAFLNYREFHLQHSQLAPSFADDIYYEALNYITPIEGIGNLGFSLYYLTYGEQEATDTEGISKGIFESYEIVPAVSYGIKIHNNIALGLNLKFLYSNLVDDKFLYDGQGKDGSGYSFAADLGFLYRARIPFLSMIDMDRNTEGYDNLRIGVSVANLGPKISYIDEDQADPLSRNIKIGVSLLPANNEEYSFLITGEIEKSLIFEDGEKEENGTTVKVEGNRVFSLDETYLKFGTELNYKDMLKLRGGYYYDKTGEVDGLTFGAGIYVKKYGFGMDFAAIPEGFGENGLVQKYSITVDIDTFMEVIK